MAPPKQDALDTNIELTMPKAAAELTQAPVPLCTALKRYFAMPLEKLPKKLRERVQAEYFSPWDELPPSKRKKIAHLLDQFQDVSTERSGEEWQRVFEKRDALHKELQSWETLEAITPTDLSARAARIADLQDALMRIDAYIKQSRGDFPSRTSMDSAGRLPCTHVSYPTAARRLTERLQAQPCEIAAWVFLGSDTGGLSAYLAPSDTSAPSQFRFKYEMGRDYISPLYGCMFDAMEIEGFQPGDRYITGAQLLDRWKLAFAGNAEPFVRAKVMQSRLTDIHPVWQRTDCTHAEDPGFPPLTEGLFSLTQIERIEDEESLHPDTSTNHSEPTGVAEEPVLAPRAAPGQTDPCGVFREMADLGANEVSLNFVGDTSETGMSANNLLEVSARGITRRIALAAFDLADRRTGSLNQQGALLVGLAQGGRVSRANEKRAATVKRLRAAFRNHLGIAGDPFMPHTKQTGWQPLFSVMDSRGAAARRAQDDAERRTVSLDQLEEAGHQITDSSSSEDELADDLDNADRWLKKHDPRYRS